MISKFRGPKQLGTAVKSLIDQDEIEAIKTLSGRRDSHCDEHQFMM